MTNPPAFEAAMRDRHRPAHQERTAADNAAFFLPYLRPGMELLDLGCGPASVTAGLAAVVVPGAATGVDLDPPNAVTGVTLVRADARELPFPEASFDAIFAHALLQHLPDPIAVLREARRVARPGAVIGVRDCDWDGQLLAPTNTTLDRSFEVMAGLREGTSPFVGKHLRSLLTEAGYVDCEATASVTYEGTPDGTRGAAEFHASLFTRTAITDQIVQRGLAEPSELAEMSAAWLAWGEHPGAFLARFWCEAIGWAA